MFSFFFIAISVVWLLIIFFDQLSSILGTFEWLVGCVVHQNMEKTCDVTAVSVTTVAIFCFAPAELNISRISFSKLDVSAYVP